MMLVGEPGIGKTRTAQELGTYARVRGARVLVGRSYEGEGAPAYWPWLQMARAYIHDADPETVVSDMGAGVSDIAQVMSDLQDLIPGLRGSASQTLEPEQARFRFFDSVTSFLKNVALRQPLVLFLDDLHWADGPSLRMLQFLAREIADSRLLVIGTYRDVSLGRVLELLEEAEDQRIVSDTSRPGTLRFMFSHALVREALYEELGVTQRVRLHRRIAEAIEVVCADDREAHLGELAHHFLEAQELERAIEYSSEAAKRAVSLMAYEEGADLYESALQALELKAPTADRRHGELLVKLAHAQTRAAEGHLAKENYRRAALLARELGDHELFAEAAEGLSGWAEIGVIDHDAIALIQEALELLGEEDSVVRARLLARLAIAIYFVDSERREQLARDAVAMARRVGDPATLAYALNDAHFVLHGPGSDNDRIQLASELIEVAEKAGDHELAIEGRGQRLMDLLEAGRIEEVDREL